MWHWQYPEVANTNPSLVPVRTTIPISIPPRDALGVGAAPVEVAPILLRLLPPLWGTMLKFPKSGRTTKTIGPPLRRQQFRRLLCRRDRRHRRRRALFCPSERQLTTHSRETSFLCVRRRPLFHSFERARTCMHASSEGRASFRTTTKILHPVDGCGFLCMSRDCSSRRTRTRRHDRAALFPSWRRNNEREGLQQ